MKNLSWLFISLFIIIADQITKIIALAHLSYATPVAVMPFVNLTLAFNKGAAFSMLGQAGGWQLWFFSCVAIAVSVGLGIYLYHLPKKGWLTKLAIALIIGGALGNVVDRVLRGYVIDFIDVYVKQWHWPVFNVADSAITIGAILFIITLMFNSKVNS
ncbi:MAG: signal peptidase II [Pseudomonadota bacterium]